MVTSDPDDGSPPRRSSPARSSGGLPNPLSQFYSGTASGDDQSDGMNEQEMITLSRGRRHHHQQHQSISVGTGASTDEDDEYDSDEYGHHDGLSHSQRQRWQNRLLRRHPSHDYEYDYLNEDGNGQWWCLTWMFLLPKRVRWLLALFLLVCAVALLWPDPPDEHAAEHGDSSSPAMVRKYKGAPQYACPDAEALVDLPGHLLYGGYRNGTYEMETLQTNETEWNAYVTEFRDLDYEDWAMSYTEVLESMRAWKVARFLPNLKTGDSIFESGSGLGLSLLLTLEIIQEESNNVRDLHLYGTNYGVAAAKLGNLLLDAVLDEGTTIGGGKRGVICAADSTRLTFVPDSSFDLVFSSRLIRLPDAWMSIENSHDDRMALARRQDVCNSAADHWKSQALYDLDRERQLEWHAKWVEELIRVAKPGVPIVVEHVSDASCETVKDWGDNTLMHGTAGGIPYSFWQNGAETRGWDVDPLSVEFEPAENRMYHVFMRKNRHAS